MDSRNIGMHFRFLGANKSLGILTTCLVILKCASGQMCQDSPFGSQVVMCEANGSTVVRAAVDLISSSGLFPENNGFLRRLAYVASEDGNHTDTFRDGYNGGIWQIDENKFQQTKVDSALEITRTALSFWSPSKIPPIVWSDVEWADLRKPLYSALAASMCLVLITEEIPGIADVEGQASFWKENFNVTETKDYFIEKVKELGEIQECKVSQLDIAVIMDGSGSIGSINFEVSKQFVIDVAKGFDIGADNVRIGVLQYGAITNVEFLMNVYSDFDDMETAIRNIVYQSGGNTYTGLAINTTVDTLFKAGDGPRNISLGVPRVGIVVTDGQSTDAVLDSANYARDAGIVMFAVGVGNVDATELDEIANDPNANYRFISSDFSSVENIISLLSFTTCLAPVITEIAKALNLENLDKDEVRYLAIPFPSTGEVTFKLQGEESLGTVCVYLSVEIPNPSEAYHEWKLNVTDENDYDQLYIDVKDFVNVTADRRKRQADGDTDLTLYAAIVNTGPSGGTIGVLAEEGDTRIALPCDDQPCKNDGECSNRGVDSFVCICLDEFDGLNCEIDLRFSCIANLVVNVVSSSQISVTWDPPTESCLADDYKVTYEVVDIEVGQHCSLSENNEMSTSWSSLNNVLLRDLKPSARYQISVTPRRNIVGGGTPLTASERTYPDVPDIAPPNVHLISVSDTTVMVSWDEIPCGNRNGAILNYLHEFSTVVDQASQFGSSSERQFLRDDLKCRTDYSFKVAATTSVGEGPYSSGYQFMTDYSTDPFDSSSSIEVTVMSPSRAKISWDSSDCSASDFTVEYQLSNRDQCFGSVAQQRSYFGVFSGETTVINDLIPFSSYNVFVSAQSSSGTTVEQAASFRTFEDVPSASPTNVIPTGATPTALLFSWGEVPCGERRGVIIGYVYEVRHPNGNTFTEETETKFVTVKYLLQNREYSFRVAAKTSDGIGEFSSEIRVKTTPATTYVCTDVPCPFGYRRVNNGQCEVARVVYFPLTITEIDGRLAVFTSELADESSEEYLELTCRVETELQAILGNDVKISGIDRGSIIVNVEVLLDKDSQLTAFDITNRLNSAITSNGNIANDLIVQDVRAVQDLCPVGYCLNGGTCTVTDVTSSPFCLCSNGFAGVLCEVALDSESGDTPDLCPIGYCSNGGTCISNGVFNPSLCLCLERFEGARCERVKVTDEPDTSEDQTDDSGLVVIIIVSGTIFTLAVVILICFLFVCFRRRRMASKPITPIAYANHSSGPALIGLDNLVDPYTIQSPWTFGPAYTTRFFPNYGDILSMQQSAWQPWGQDNVYF